MFGNIFNQKKGNEQPGQAPEQGSQPVAQGQGAPQDPNQQYNAQSQDPNNQQNTPNGASPDSNNQQNNGTQPNGQPVAGGPSDGQQGAQTGQPGDQSGVQQAGQPGGQPGQEGAAQGPQDPNAPGNENGNQPGQQQAAGQNGQTPDGKGGTTPNNPALRADMSSLSHLDPRATQVLTHAQEETRRIKQQFIEPDQILFGLLYDEQIFKLFAEFQVEGGKISKEVQAREKMGTYKGQPTLSKTSQGIFDQAYRDSKMRGSNFVSPEDLFVVISAPTTPTGKYLTEKGIKKEAIVEKLAKNPNSNYARKTVLEKYGIDLTEEARAGRLDPVAGRDKEVDRMVHVLLRRTKNNPIIIGEPGVGKTAIVEGLAQLIVSGKVPKDLQDKRIFQLEVSSLVAGASHRGEFEERMRAVVNEVLGANNKILLFIDEIHSLLGTGEGEGVSAANIIKPHLARGHFQLIGATTTTEYRKNFEKDKAFERRFQPVTCEEPSIENAIAMLKIIRPKYEKFHRVTVSDDTLKECVKLSKKYIGERYLPDKAIDLLDEAASHVKLQGDSGKRGDTQVKKSDIETVVSAWTGIPITKLTEDESEKLLKLEDRIHHRMVDQEEAVVAVSEAVRRGRIGLASGERPIASFIFLGPTGVGKTELAKTLAELLFGRDDSMARLDMSEFMEKHEVAKLIGAPPGYVGYEEGGVLTEAVRKKPYCIVLMDEIEKAHPDVFNILLQLLEDGRLTDNKGNTISFKNTIVICTSNIGSSLIMQHLGQMDPNAKPTAEQLNKQYKELDKIIRDELTKFLRPEVLNRFDEVIIFKPLRPEHMAGIVRLGIAKTAALLKEQGYALQITEKAIAKLAKDGYDPVYGARPLRRLIQTAIENPIALAIISKKFAIGDTIVIDYNDNLNEYMFLKGGQAADEKALTDEQFKLILQKVAHPETLVSDSDKNLYTPLHEKAVSASTGGNTTASGVLSVTAATSSGEIKRIRMELEEASKKGDELAKAILDIASTVAQQVASANNIKKTLLMIVNPQLVSSPEKKETYIELHDKLIAAGEQNAIAHAVLAITQDTPPDAIDKLIEDLKQAKEGEDELASEILILISSDVAEQAEKAHEADPSTKFKGVLKQIINPLYAADPENKDKFSKLYEKISEAGKQNHPIAAAILAITDITSDSDILLLQEQLKQGKEQGDPLAIEIIQTIDAAIKYEGVKHVKDTLLLVVNPITAKTPAEREQYTEVQGKVSQASQKGHELAVAIMAVSDATTDDDILKLKEQIEKGEEKEDEIAVLIANTLSGKQPDPVPVAADGTPQDPNAPKNPDEVYPFGKGPQADGSDQQPQADAGQQDPNQVGQQPTGQQPMGQQPMGQPPIGQQPIGQPQLGPLPMGQAPAGNYMNQQPPMPQGQGYPGVQMPQQANPNTMPVGTMAMPPQNMQPQAGYIPPVNPMPPANTGYYQQQPGAQMMPPAGNMNTANMGGGMAGAAAVDASKQYPPVMNEALSTGVASQTPGVEPNEQT